ncbi:Basic-leucine zipper domain [Sesbania bispinosa]|nr:Basic-leucine zipper domain [Sesbania bispinosa]
MAAAPVSPVSPDGGLGGGEKLGVGGQFGMEMGVLRGRKRMLDGPVEKVVERRQRRMIKNRESAARSRARKQAYTVELEAELNQLKEENAQLKLALVELERRRKQQNLEEMNGRSVETSAERVEKNLIALKRNRSCPLL